MTSKITCEHNAHLFLPEHNFVAWKIYFIFSIVRYTIYSCYRAHIGSNFNDTMTPYKKLSGSNIIFPLKIITFDSKIYFSFFSGLKRRTSDIEEDNVNVLEYGPGMMTYDAAIQHQSQQQQQVSKVDTIAMEDVEAALVLMKLGSPKVDLGILPSRSYGHAHGSFTEGNHSLGDHSLNAHYNYWAVANMSGISPESGVEACSPATPSPPSQEVALINSLGARYAAVNASRMASKSKKRMRDLIGTQEQDGGGEEEQIDEVQPEVSTGEDAAMEESDRPACFNFTNSDKSSLHFNFSTGGPVVEVKSEELPDEEEPGSDRDHLNLDQRKHLFQPVKVAAAGSPFSGGMYQNIHNNISVVSGQQQQQQPQQQIAIAQSSLDEGIDLKDGGGGGSSLIDPPEICVKTMKKVSWEKVIHEKSIQHKIHTGKIHTLNWHIFWRNFFSFWPWPSFVPFHSV